jgi:hypothetical protein
MRAQRKRGLGPVYRRSRSAQKDPARAPDNSHRFDALMKEYELTTNRLDKTDDRIIQLVSIGLAALGAIFLFLKQTQPSGTSSGVILLSTISIDDNMLSRLREKALPCLLAYIVLYGVLRIVFRYLYSQNGFGRPFPPSFTGYLPLSYKEILTPSFRLSSPFIVTKREKKIRKLKAEAMNRGDKTLAKDLGTLHNYEERAKKDGDKDSLKWMRLPYVIPPIIFAVIIPITEICFAPALRSQKNPPALELLWLAPLFFVGFNSLIIYVLYSSFGHLWVCRTLSQRVNWLLGEKILVRFDRDLIPSRFFSFGTGNWKPRMSYWLLLGTIGVLFCWVIAVCFAQVYVKSWEQGSIFLAVYLFAAFLQLFTFSGIRHDLQNRHEIFFKEEEDNIKEELWPEQIPDAKRTIGKNTPV